MTPIAILSLSCRYPDACTPEALWDNVLDGRRSFRSLPPERLDLSAYAPGAVGDADTITPIRAGLITDWLFDRERFRIPKTAYESTDLAHWLGLEVAAEAVEQSGGPDLLDRDRTAVIVGNTLTGEFSRAAMLRLRAPFLDSILADVLAEFGVHGAAEATIRDRFGAALRARFAEPTEEMLAGGLANTIAGRIANYFDFRGGAFLVDAACASSLVAITSAASMLSAREIDAAVVTAVDLSLDPFELVGFSRNGALARSEMLVFDAKSSGFWPGEGAAAAVLMRVEDARRKRLPILAQLRGWGLSTDGWGGLTRPTVKGQVAALQRAYASATVDCRDVAYIEAHGTGTAIGDPIEVQAIAAVRDGADEPIYIGSIKANIGHTKAAAGFAGLIKAVKALQAHTIPPHVGCNSPHPIFERLAYHVRPALEPKSWPKWAAPIAGVSAFGFGGINSHVVVEGSPISTPACAKTKGLESQDAELFLFAGPSPEDVGHPIEQLAHRAPQLSISEFVDTAAACASVASSGRWRAAVVARDPEMLRERLEKAADALRAGTGMFDVAAGIFIGEQRAAPRIGFLFPGQAAPSRPDGGAWGRRFRSSRDLAHAVPADVDADATHTSVAQPAITAASLAGLHLLRQLRIEASTAIGHSLGELTALAWANVLPEAKLIEIAAARGRIMTEDALDQGSMIRVALSVREAEDLADGLGLAVACENASAETVLSGPIDAVKKLSKRAQSRGIDAHTLPVSHAFHSPMMAPAIPRFTKFLAGVPLGALSQRVYSTVTGRLLGSRDDIASLLGAQFVSTVRFREALSRMASECDLLIEVGPGAGLTRLGQSANVHAISIDAFGNSLAPLLSGAGAAFALGTQLNPAPFFADRCVRSINLGHTPVFLTSPCGRRGEPVASPSRPEPEDQTLEDSGSSVSPPHGLPTGGSKTLEVPSSKELQAITEIVSDETGLSPSSLSGTLRFLDDLHLNSLSVTRIVTHAATKLGIAVPRAPADFANATLCELAGALAEMRNIEPHAEECTRVDGVRRWIRSYGIEWAERPPREPGPVIDWEIIALADEPCDLRSLLPQPDPGAERGVILWLSDDADDTVSLELLHACQKAWREAAHLHLAFCHAGAPLSAFARSIALERRFRSVRVIERSHNTDCRKQIATELSARCNGFAEVRIDAAGGRTEPVFAPVEVKPVISDKVMFDRNDVILVTGGARGIGAECAVRIALCTGAAVILVGRSMVSHPDVTRARDRLEALGIRFRYVSADVADAERLQAGVAEAVGELGPVTAVVHAAGVNDPKPFSTLVPDDLVYTFAPKAAGLRAVFAAAGPNLRRLVTFGSIIGRTGLAGEAHYALANAWQTVIGETLALEYPHVSVLNLEWSVWSGAGMGERTGAVEKLARNGVDPLSMDDALDAFTTLFLGNAAGSLIVTSRFGPVPYSDLAPADLPVFRFVDEPLVHFPGVELVIETEVTLARDPYLLDHVIDGAHVLPGVLALEAMAQVASALHNSQVPYTAENVSFAGAVIVPDAGSVRVRIATLALEDGRIEAVLRVAADGFLANRVRATFAYMPEPDRAEIRGASHASSPTDASELYGKIFFHGQRFRRVDHYDEISARRLSAILLPEVDQRWFGTFEPQSILLPDPGARDAALHMLQAGVPHKRVLPVAVDKIVFRGGTAVRVVAEEQRASADAFVFDIVALGRDNQPVEEWRGATFRAIEGLKPTTALSDVPALIPVYIERMAREYLKDDTIEIAMAINPVSSRGDRRATVLAAVGLAESVVSRSDGKPEILGPSGALGISLSHRESITLAAKARGTIGCDIELIANLGALDDDVVVLPQALHPAAAHISALRNEAWPVAASRIWVASEALRKLGTREPSFTAEISKCDNACVLVCESDRVLTLGPIPCGSAGEVMIGVVVRSEDRPARQALFLPTLAEASP